MNLLVTGATGQVGWELARSLMPLGEVIALDRTRCDLSRPESLREVLTQVQPDVIVNAAAYTAVDKAESDEATALMINAEAVGQLAGGAREIKALLIHYSTDYVFDGSQAKPYVETDPVCPINAYGRSKLAGEQAIQASGCDYLIFRTSWVYASRGQNFVRTMLRLGKERESLSVVDDQHGAPTWARNIADMTAQAIVRATRERAGDAFASGIFHMGAKGETSWHGFAEAIFAQARQQWPEHALALRQLNAIPSTSYPLPARRPAYSLLNCAAIEQRFGIVVPHWQAALPLCLQELVAR